MIQAPYRKYEPAPLVQTPPESPSKSAFDLTSLRTSLDNTPSRLRSAPKGESPQKKQRSRVKTEVKSARLLNFGPKTTVEPLQPTSVADEQIQKIMRIMIKSNAVGQPMPPIRLTTKTGSVINGTFISFDAPLKPTIVFLSTDFYPVTKVNISSIASVNAIKV